MNNPNQIRIALLLYLKIITKNNSKEFYLKANFFKYIISVYIQLNFVFLFLIKNGVKN